MGAAWEVIIFPSDEIPGKVYMSAPNFQLYLTKEEAQNMADQLIKATKPQPCHVCGHVMEETGK